MVSLKAFVIAHWPWFMLFIGYPVITSVLNWYLWFDTPEHWESFQKRRPKAALALKWFRAVSPVFRKLVTAWRDYAARNSFNPSAPRTPTMPAPPPSPPSA